MSDDIAEIVLVGGGLAAAKAAETLRKEGFDGGVTLVTDEPERPYERPPLSKGVLTGDQALTGVYVHDVDFYARHDITLITDDPVTAIDRQASKVTTRSGAHLAFDRLLLATGAAPRRLFGDRELDGVLTLRTLADARRLAQQLRDVDHVTVVGAGWVGSEIAAAARTLGTEVAMVDPLDVPLQRVLGRDIGGVFAGLHRRHGVDLHMGVGVSDVRGTGRVEQVALSDGTAIDTQLVVVGIGVVPRTGLAVLAGLHVDDGVVVDAKLTSSDPRILAAGDVANAWHPTLRTQLRVEHWANALHQGQVAARNLLGADEHYDRVPYFYSDQYDLGMEYVGHAPRWEEVVLRGDREANEFIAFWIHDRHVVAAMNVNVWDVVDDLTSIVAAQRPIDPDLLADTRSPLADIAASG